MSPIRMSKIESAMRVVLDFKDAFNRHDVAGIMQLMNEDAVFESYHPVPDGALYTGKDAITQFWQDLFRESLQAQLKVEEIFGLGERCVMRWKYTWAEAGGGEGHLRGVDIVRVVDGAIQEMYSYVKGQPKDR